MARNSRRGATAIGALLVVAACGGRTDTTAGSTSGTAQTVTIYVSTDRVFSEPVLRESV